MGLDASTVEQAIVDHLNKENTYDCYNSRNYAYEAEELFDQPQEVKADVVTIEIEDSQFGGEDKFPSSGGEIYVIFKVTSAAGVQYFKKSGWYQSYAGSEWNEPLTEVKLTTKTITVFE